MDKKKSKLNVSYFNTILGSLKGVFLNLEDSVKKKIVWKVWESHEDNYDNYDDFKNNWNSNNRLRDEIKNRLGLNTNRKISNLIDANNGKLSKNIELKKNNNIQK